MKLKRIIELTKEVLDEEYHLDCLLALDFINKRDFDSLQFLVKSVEAKDKLKEIPTLPLELLLGLQTLIEEYIEQLQYIPENNNE